MSSRSSGPLPDGYGNRTDETRQPVWVDLDALFPAPAAGGDGSAVPGSGPPARPGGPAARRTTHRYRGRLLCRGEVAGVLHTWERATDGRWLPVVSYLIPATPDDPRPGRSMDFVLAPLHAVRPRDPDQPHHPGQSHDPGQPHGPGPPRDTDRPREV